MQIHAESMQHHAMISLIDFPEAAPAPVREAQPEAPAPRTRMPILWAPDEACEGR